MFEWLLTSPGRGFSPLGLACAFSGLLCFWLYKRTENRVYSILNSLCIWGFLGSILLEGVYRSVEVKDPAHFFIALFVVGMIWLFIRL